MPKKSTLVVIVIAVLVLAVGARGGGKWLAQKVRVMHGAH